MGFRQLDYEVNTDCVPWFRQCLQGVELTEGSSVLQLHLVTQIAGFDIDADVPRHLWPPIIARYDDNLNTTQTPECSKGKYNAKIIK
jgi:hypothetical protein